MLNRFKRFIAENNLFTPSQRILIAVSGGVDSMVLADLSGKAGINYALVHCNFQLRGAESDGDEEFVRKYAEKTGCRLFVKSFDTKEYARLNGVSIEMAARELRYDYFNELRRQSGYDLIATAHHQDDLIETFFINLIRKTGIRGLTGISVKSGNLIRPLLFANRNMILNYATREGIPFREDSSNASVVINRNYIRHKILPGLEEINPSARKNILESIQNLKEVEEIFLNVIKKTKEEVTGIEQENLVIFTDKLLKTDYPRVLLYEMLSSYHFNSSVIKEIFSSLEDEPGKQFYSPTHRVVKDRGKLIVTRNTVKSPAVFYIEEGDLELFNPINLKINWFDAKGFSIPHDSTIACLDYDKLFFPLIVKTWLTGEYFRPLGMKGFKKISDFFIDEKLSIPEKENAWILYSGNKVAWVMGHRIDDRFKITSKTSKIYKLEII